MVYDINSRHGLSEGVVIPISSSVSNLNGIYNRYGFNGVEAFRVINEVLSIQGMALEFSNVQAGEFFVKNSKNIHVIDLAAFLRKDEKIPTLHPRENRELTRKVRGLLYTFQTTDRKNESGDKIVVIVARSNHDLFSRNYGLCGEEAVEQVSKLLISDQMGLDYHNALRGEFSVLRSSSISFAELELLLAGSKIQDSSNVFQVTGRTDEIGNKIIAIKSKAEVAPGIKREGRS